MFFTIFNILDSPLKPKLLLVSSRSKAELNYICHLHGAFPSAFPAVDGSLFHSLPVVALLDKYIVTEGMWVAESALSI